MQELSEGVAKTIPDPEIPRPGRTARVSNRERENQLKLKDRDCRCPPALDISLSKTRHAPAASRTVARRKVQHQHQQLDPFGIVNEVPRVNQAQIVKWAMGTWPYQRLPMDLEGPARGKLHPRARG